MLFSFVSFQKQKNICYLSVQLVAFTTTKILDLSMTVKKIARNSAVCKAVGAKETHVPVKCTALLKLVAKTFMSRVHLRKT